MMHIVEFEADVKNNQIEIPGEYKGLASKHVKVTLVVDETLGKYDFSDIQGKLEWSGDEVSLQRKLRDEW